MPISPVVWLAESSAEASGECADGSLDASERLRAAGFARAEDRRRYVRAHVVLRDVLGHHLGLEPAAVVLTRLACPLCGGPHGRPSVDGQLHFSLSYRAELVLVAVSDHPVGVDVEQVGPVLPDVLHPRERAVLAAAAPVDRPAAFARVWTRTEAYLKAIGTGLGRDPSLDDTGVAELAGWTITDLAVPAGFAAAVATPGGGAVPSVRRWNAPNPTGVANSEAG